MSGVVVRPAAPSDQDQWAALYAGYAQFYKVEQTPEMRARVWDWIHDPAHEVEGLVAEADGRLVGLAHFRAFARPLSATVAGFLDDLFVDPSARGQGAAQQLIAAVSEEGRKRGWSVIRWLTSDSNYRARAVYDEVATPTAWKVYDLTPAPSGS
jgi:GNAT superfamily N-acetyltransferase